jgi:hypothetical protein
MATRSTDAEITKNDDETVDVTLPKTPVEEEIFSSNPSTAAEIIEDPAERKQDKSSSSVEKTAEEQGSQVQSEEDSEDEELSRQSESVQKRINKLTKRMREAERREKAALDYAKGLKKQNDEISANAQVTGNSHLAEYENRLTLEEEALKSALQKAVNSGDVDAQMEVQKRIAQHALDSEKLVQAKRYAEQQAAQQAETPNQQAGPNSAQQPETQPPSEGWNQQQTQPDPKAEEWAERNVWFGNDEPMTLTAFSIHKELLLEGYTPSSDAYYEKLESQLKENFPHKAEQVQSIGGNTSSPTRRPSGVAPAGGARRDTKSNNSVRLSQSEVAIARKLGVSLEDYARNVKILQNRQATS